MTREEAIQILSTRDAHGVPCGYTSGYQEAYDMAIEALEHEPRKGKWIVYEMHTTTYGKVGFECSACGVPYKLEHRLGADVGWHYCPTCGAKMERCKG